MKKRKPPVILASCLVVLLGAAIIINLPKRPTAEDMGGPQAKAPDSSPGVARKTDDPSTIKKQLAVEDGMAGREGMMNPDDPTGAGSGANPKVATIYIPRAQAVKPTPNDASVQGQWYKENARANNPEGFKAP